MRFFFTRAINNEVRLNRVIFRLLHDIYRNRFIKIRRYPMSETLHNEPFTTHSRWRPPPKLPSRRSLFPFHKHYALVKRPYNVVFTYFIHLVNSNSQFFIYFLLIGNYRFADCKLRLAHGHIFHAQHNSFQNHIRTGRFGVVFGNVFKNQIQLVNDDRSRNQMFFFIINCD